MKIYEIGTGYTPIPAQMGAATEIVVEELTRSFLKNGNDAEIIDIQAQNRQDTELPISEVKVPRMFTKTDVSLGVMHKLKRVIYSIALAKKLKTVLRCAKEKVVLHFHNQYNLFFFLKLVPKKLRQRAVIAYTVHSYIWGTEWEEIQTTVKKRYFQECFCVQNSDAVFVLNDITKKHFVSRLGVDDKRIHKVLNGVNVERYCPIDEQLIHELKKKYDLESKKIIFQVGSVCPRKNQLGSVQMLVEYLKQDNDVVYMYAGGLIDESYQQQIVEFSKRNGIEQQVRYLGEVPPGERLNSYYNMADCCVFTSTLESFGLVIIEAIAAGTPVVLGDNLMFELSDGYHMYQNSDEFVSLIDSILKGKENNEKPFRNSVERYSWNEVARTYVKFFRG